MLYVHIPCCKGKCIYCDFYSAGCLDWGKYIKAVAAEFAERINELKGESLSSIYIGGGTPSLMPNEYFAPFLTSIKNIITLNNIELDAEIEVTLEVNPEDVTEQKINVWKQAGVNRVSMGVQSLDDTELSFLRRRHDASKAVESLKLLQSEFSNISVDLIYGIPGQTKVTLEKTLDRILEFRPQHISTYSLTYEEKTPLYLLRESGRISDCPEETYLEFEKMISNRLKKEGYERYEISNYAKPGFRSRHNSGYWKGTRYLGLGPAASSFDGKNVRRTNPSDIKKYLDRFAEGLKEESFYTEEKLNSEELMEERIFISLRTKDGIDIEKFGRDFGQYQLNILLSKAQRWIETDDMISESGRLHLTEKGISISDYIIVDLA